MPGKGLKWLATRRREDPDRALFARLAKERDSAAREAAERLLHNGSQDVDTYIRRVEACNAVLGAAPAQQDSRLPGALIVGSVCIALAGAGWVGRWHTTTVVLNLKSTAVMIGLSDALEWKGRLPIDAETPEIRLAGADELKVDNVPHRGPHLKRDLKTVRLRGGQVLLSGLRVGKAGTLMMTQQNNGSLRLTVRCEAEGCDPAGKFEVVLNVDEKTRIRPKKFEAREQVHFLSSAGRNPTAYFPSHPGAELVFKNLKVDRLSFSVEEGSGNFRSSVKGGTVLLTDINEKFELTEEEVVSLGGLEGSIREIRIGEAIKVAFSGKTKAIRIGFKGSERDIRPTILSYIYHNRPLSFFFGSITFLWGISWSARRLLFA